MFYFSFNIWKKHKAIIWIWIATSIIAWSPVFSQNKDSLLDKTNKTLIEVLDSTNRENLSKKFKWILEDNWEVKWLEIIQKYILVWINDIRKNNSLDQLDLNDNLCKAAQNYAIEMDETKKFWHVWKNKSTPKIRTQKAWYESDFVFENLWKDFFLYKKQLNGGCYLALRHIKIIYWEIIYQKYESDITMDIS